MDWECEPRAPFYICRRVRICNGDHMYAHGVSSGAVYKFSCFLTFHRIHACGHTPTASFEAIILMRL